MKQEMKPYSRWDDNWDREPIWVPEKPGIDPVLAIPSKGPLQKGSERLLEVAGLAYQKKERRCTTWGSFTESRGLWLVFMRPKDIVKRLVTEDLFLGVVGEDVIRESLDRNEIGRTEKLGFGNCSLVLAVSEVDSKGRENDIRIEDLAGKRVGTSYPRSTKKWFEQSGIPVEIVEQEGAVEGMIRMGWADAIVDLTETGRSLQENKLKVLEKIYDSETVLVTCRSKSFSDDALFKRDSVVTPMFDSVSKMKYLERSQRIKQEELSRRQLSTYTERYM
jgi:ATP phosphoribosyltransferase